MLSDVTSLAGLVQQAPALAVAAVALLFAGWTYRQARRALAAAEHRLTSSAIRQGERLGKLTRAVDMLDLRRRIIEDELLDAGLRLSFWPPDGPEQRRPAENYPDDTDRDDTDRADDDGPHTAAAPYLPVPPLPEGFAARHRRTTP